MSSKSFTFNAERRYLFGQHASAEMNTLIYTVRAGCDAVNVSPRPLDTLVPSQLFLLVHGTGGPISGPVKFEKSLPNPAWKWGQLLWWHHQPVGSKCADSLSNWRNYKHDSSLKYMTVDKMKMFTFFRHYKPVRSFWVQNVTCVSAGKISRHWSPSRDHRDQTIKYFSGKQREFNSKVMTLKKAFKSKKFCVFKDLIWWATTTHRKILCKHAD